MDTFDEFLARKITTKARLLDAISKLPDDVVLCSTSADLGGYDVIEHNYLVIDVVQKDGKSFACFGHFEYEAYEQYQKGNLTHEQFELLNDENDK